MKKKLFIQFSLFTTVLIAIFGYFAYQDYQQYEQTYKENKIVNLEHTYRAVFNNYEELSKLLFTTSINKPDIIKIAAEGMENNRSEARIQLLSRLDSEYRILSQYGLKQLHFHTKEGLSFLRMHQPDKFGDPLFTARPTVKACNTQQKYISGFEEGKIYNGFRFVFPLNFEGKHIGSVETSISADAIISQMKKVHADSYQFFLSKPYMEKLVFKEFWKNYNSTKLSSLLVTDKSSKIDPLQEQLNSKLADNEAINDLFDAKKPFVLSETMETDNNAYVVTFIPLQNFSGNVCGWFVQYSPDQTLCLYKKEFYYKLLFITFVYISVLVILFYLSREIDLRRRAQEELTQLNVHLEHEIENQVEALRQKDIILVNQSRHAVMGEMISAIAHQWRQPLNALALVIQDIPDAWEYGELTDEYVEKFRETAMLQITHMSSTIDDFRNYFKEGQQFTKTTLSHSVHECLKLVESQFISNSITITQTYLDDPEVVIKEGAFRQVLLNLLSNAKDQIIETKPVNNTVDIIVSQDDNMAILRIIDHAGGIPENVIDKIFEPYFSTKGEKGTGVGLYMSHMIIEDKLSGRLMAYNGDDGAVFEIRIPITVAEKV